MPLIYKILLLYQTLIETYKLSINLIIILQDVHTAAHWLHTLNRSYWKMNRTSITLILVNWYKFGFKFTVSDMHVWYDTVVARCLVNRYTSHLVLVHIPSIAVVELNLSYFDLKLKQSITKKWDLPQHDISSNCLFHCKANTAKYMWPENLTGKNVNVKGFRRLGVTFQSQTLPYYRGSCQGRMPLYWTNTPLDMAHENYLRQINILSNSLFRNVIVRVSIIYKVLEVLMHRSHVIY